MNKAGVLSSIADILLVGWCYSQPAESVFGIVKGLHPHAPIDCDGYPEPLRVKDWLLQNIREL